MIPIEVKVKFPKVYFENAVIVNEVEKLADRLAATMTAQTQIALLSFRAKATGGTLRSIKPGGLRIATAYFQRRQVIASEGFKFIVSGRRKGAKMPIRMVGVGPRGGKIFEPLPALVRWFNVLGIPKAAWFPILRSISRKGIKPRNVPARAIKDGRRAVQNDVRAAVRNISRNVIKVVK